MGMCCRARRLIQPDPTSTARHKSRCSIRGEILFFILKLLRKAQVKHKSGNTIFGALLG